MTLSGLDKKAQLSRGTGEREDEHRAADSHLEPDFGVGSAEPLGVLSDTAFERFEELCRFHSYRLANGPLLTVTRLEEETARCTIKSRKQVGDALNLLTACATDIMLQNVEFTVKFLDDNKISRLFPGMEGMEITYCRSAL
jgi:hypothetical protein